MAKSSTEEFHSIYASYGGRVGLDLRVSGFTEEQLRVAYDTDENLRHAVHEAYDKLRNALLLNVELSDPDTQKRIAGITPSVVAAFADAGIRAVYVEDTTPPLRHRSEIMCRDLLVATELGLFAVKLGSDIRLNWSRTSMQMPTSWLPPESWRLSKYEYACPGTAWLTIVLKQLVKKNGTTDE